MAFSEDDLKKMGLEKQPDGSYAPKKKANPDPLTVKKIIEAYKQTSIIPVDYVQTSYCYEFDVDPMGKPRMTQQDKWKKRPATDRYWELKRHMKAIADGYNFVMPESNYHMIFYIPMPDSWPKSKKEEMNGKPHKQRPDRDNLEKAILDALCPEDSYIWDGRTTKLWAYKGKIVIKNL